MRRFLRRFLLVTFILTLYFWIVSYVEVLAFDHTFGRWELAYSHIKGRIQIYLPVERNPRRGSLGYDWGYKSIFKFAGLTIAKRADDAQMIEIPFWMIAAALSLPLFLVWYRPLKTKSDRKGFEVEMMKNERGSTELAEVQDAELAKGNPGED